MGNINELNRMIPTVMGATIRRFYVDATGGNDSALGRSPDSAWQTIAKVNATSFGVRDHILFKRGETWSGTQLAIAWNRITIDAYGSGTRPKIQPAVASDSAVNITGNYVTIKNIHALTQAHQTQLTRSFFVLGHDIVIDSCVAEGDKTLGTPFNNALGFEVYGAGSIYYNIIIKNCEAYNFYRNGGCGIHIGAGSGVGPTNITLDNNIIYDVGPGTYTFNHFGIYLLRADQVTCQNNLVYNTDSDGIQIEYATNSMIERNTVHDAGLRGIGIFYTTVGDNTFVQNNLIYSCRDSGIRIENSAEAHIYHNTLINNATTVANRYSLMLMTGITGSIVKNNLILQDRSVIDVTRCACLYAENQTVIDNSTIDNNCCLALNKTPLDRAYNLAGTNASLATWQAAGADPNGISTDPIFVSSIHTTVNANSNAAQKVLNVASTTGFNVGETVSINPLGARMEYGVIDTIQVGISLTLLVNLTYTHTAAQADSVLSCVWTDLHLQSTSPCIGVGDATVGVVDDMDGIIRGAAVDIGAYEYVA